MTVLLLLGLMCLIAVVWAVTPVLNLNGCRLRRQRTGEPGLVEVPLGYVRLGHSSSLRPETEQRPHTARVRPARTAKRIDQPWGAVGVARPEEFLRAAQHEGAALRSSLENPVVRPWAPEAISAWERRVERLIERDVAPRREPSRSGPMIGSAGSGGGYEPGAEMWWLKFRIDRGIAELDRMIDVLDSPSSANGERRSDRHAGVDHANGR